MQGIKRRLVFNYGIILFLAVFVLELVFIISVRQYYYESIGQTVQGRATASAAFYNKYLAYDPLRDKARYIFENTSGEDKVMIEVIDLQGKVISSSSGVITGAKAITPDMKKAREGVTGRWTGRDKATGEKILAVSTPLKYDQRTISGILRYSSSLGFADKQITRLALVALLLGFMVIALSLLLSIMLARSIINPVQELTKTAKKLAEGNYRVKAVKRNDDEIGELAETFNYMADEITKSDRVKNEFISSISHELRTPLTSIKGWSETILDGELEDKEEALQGLKIIVRETDRLTGLVEELLDFSRFEAGRVRLVTARVNNDRRKNTAKNHTTTHILHKVLKEMLGQHVNQAGSYVSEDRLRFDYTHFEAVSHETLKEIEKKVIEFALKNNNQNRKWTADSLGISERALRYKIKEYNLN